MMSTQHGKPEHTKAEWMKAWDYQIKQFDRVWPDSLEDMKRIRELQAELTEIISREADNLFDRGDS